MKNIGRHAFLDLSIVLSLAFIACLVPRTEARGGGHGGVAPTVGLPLGTTTLDLLVDDGRGQQATDSTSVTVVDTTAPVVTATLVPVRANGRAGTYQVSIRMVDAVDPSPLIVATLNGEPVGNGEIVRLLPGKRDQVRDAAPTTQYQGAEIILSVSATDFSGNIGTGSAVLPP